MKNLDKFMSGARGVLQKHLHKLWLAVLLLTVPFGLQANFVSIASTAKLHGIAANRHLVRATLWNAMGLATTNKAMYDGGDFSLNFVASAPYSYDHSTGGGAFDDGTTNTDIVESLEGGDFACGDVVTFLTQIKVDAGAAGAQTIDLDYSFLADATGQSGVALSDILTVKVNYGTVAGGDGAGSTDSGIMDDGGSIATLTNERITGDGTLFNDNELVGTVTVTDLEAGETVIVRMDVLIACDPGSSPTGNLQGAIVAGLVVDPAEDNISVGNQTVPFKNVDQIQFPGCGLAEAGPVCNGATTTHTATSEVDAATYTWTLTGTSGAAFADGGTTKVTTAAAGAMSSGVDVVAGNAGSYTLSVVVSKRGYSDQSCNVSVVVEPQPEVVVQPTPASVCGGETISFTVAFAGSSLATDVQWQIDTGSGFVDLDDYGVVTTTETTSTLDLTDLSNTMKGVAEDYSGNLRAVISGGTCAAVYSDVVPFTIYATPPAPIVQNITECATEPLQTLAAVAPLPVVFYDAPTGGNVVQNPQLNEIGTVTYYAEGVSSEGCRSLTRTPVTLTINPLPEVDAGADQTLTCTTTDVTLNGSSTTEGVTYMWSGPDGFTSSDQSPVVSAAGIYTLTVTNTATGCTNSDQVEVKANYDVPIVRITASETARDDCDGKRTLYGSANIENAVYSWSGPDGFTATTRIIEVTVAGTYTLTVKDPANGCTATAEQPVSFIPVPVANAGPDKVLTCKAPTVILEGSSNVKGAVATTWTAIDGGHIVSGAGTYTPVVDAAGKYILQTRDPISSCFTVDTVEVTLDMEAPEIAAYTRGFEGVLTCKNKDVLILIQSNVENGVYSWTGPNGFTADSGAIVVTVAGVYTLTVTNPLNGCQATTSIEITEFYPDLNANAGPDKVLTCADRAVTLSGDGLTTAFKWTTTDGHIVSGDHNRDAVVDKPGTYVLTAIDVKTGCTETDTVIVRLNTTLPNIMAQGGTLDCNTGTLQLMGSSTTEGAAYSWAGPMGYTSMEQNPTVSLAGEYTLTVTDPENGCSAMMTVTVHPQPTVPEPEITCYQIDFENSNTGFVNSVTTGAGVVDIFNRKRNVDGTYASENHASIFDTANPTGDDLDLWTPDWGHVLIINQDLNPEPNDNPWGGEMTLDFSAFGPVTMTSLKALDFDVYEGNSWVYLYDGAGNELYKVQIQNLGNMSQQVVDLGNTKGVMMLKVVLDGRNSAGMLAGSGAIDDIKFCVEEAAEDPCIRPLAMEIKATAFPMPFSDKTTLEFTANEAQEYVVQLFDARGRMIRELKSGTMQAGEVVTIEVDGRDLPNGMYIANIVGKAGVKKSVKLINKK